MPNKLRIIFLGGGNLAEAMFSRLSSQQYEIIVIQRNPIKLTALQQKYKHIKCFATLNFALNASDILILAVKPQDAVATCNSLGTVLSIPLIVSVMAAIDSTILAKLTHNSRIVRAMPSVLATVAKSSTGIFFTADICHQEQEQVTTIFDCIGSSYVLATEEQINVIAAVAASSPAYLYYFLEGMIDSACKLGLTQAKATQITLEVVTGSVALLEHHRHKTLVDLRQSITSAKGTTEAAIATFAQAKLAEIIFMAEQKSIARAQEIAQGVTLD